jgi:hypothetical protein
MRARNPKIKAQRMENLILVPLARNLCKSGPDKSIERFLISSPTNVHNKLVFLSAIGCTRVPPQFLSGALPGIVFLMQRLVTAGVYFL